MNLLSIPQHRLHQCFWSLVGLGFILFCQACTSPPTKPELPPSASDLPILRSGKLCDQSMARISSGTTGAQPATPWGMGSKIRNTSRRDAARAVETYFFDPESYLIGFHLSFPQGLLLDPYPVLRDTLEALPPTLEFYSNLSGLTGKDEPLTTRLFLTGDEKSTTQYLVTGPINSGTLLSVSLSVDPYVDLLSPYRKEFLQPLGTTVRNSKGPGAEDAESFAARQAFARGETALLAYCGQRNDKVAASAYRQALQEGFTNKKLLAETHHKLGLALKGQGRLEEAKTSLEKSLEIMPDRPEVLNNLGQIYKELGNREKAIANLERAVGLRPNYPIARFNLAEMYEGLNRRRAIAEYETYLALAEELYGEEERVTKARQRLKELSR